MSGRMRSKENSGNWSGPDRKRQRGSRGEGSEGEGGGAGTPLVSRPLLWPRTLLWRFLASLLALEPSEVPKKDWFTPSLTAPACDAPTLPASFKDADEYRRLWLSLLLLETAASVSSYRGEDSEASGGASLHSKHDRRHGTVVRELARVSECAGCVLRILAVSVPLTHDYNDGDLLLLRVDSSVGLAVVITADPDLATGGDEERDRELCLVVGHGLEGSGLLHMGALAEGACVHFFAMANIVTSLRQCRALDSIGEVALKGQLLSATVDESSTTVLTCKPAGMSPGLWTALRSSLNEAQMQTVLRACAIARATPANAVAATKPVLLVQGPPGTGKTVSAIGLMSALLAGCGNSSTDAAPIVAGASLLKRIAASGTASAASHDITLGRPRPHRSAVKLLICAPSNAAVDEVILRIKRYGIIGTDGRRRSDIRVVRVGRGGRKDRMSGLDVAAAAVVDACGLEALVERGRVTFTGSEYGSSVSDLKLCILEEADVICCTLSAAGGATLTGAALRSSHFAFDALIVDEATQALELDVLIPLRLRPRLVVLVGDPCQLRPTVLSDRAARRGFGVSLFERLYRNGYPYIMLQQQYRMHANIAAYPSQHFYNNALITDAKVNARPAMNFHSDVSRRFEPLVLHHVSGREKSKGSSIMNAAEIAALLALYMQLMAKYPSARALEVGIVCAYTAMRDEVRRVFLAQLGSKGLDKVSIATIDGFQGREVDLLFFCCVRSTRSNDKKPSLAFIGERSRINVAITRAKHSLWVIGNFHVLQNDKEWRALIAHARANDLLREEELLLSTSTT